MKKTPVKKDLNPKETPKHEAGAPAVLRRLEADALEYTKVIDVKKGELVRLRSVRETKDIREKIAVCEMELASANDSFVSTAKVLLQYDKSVKEDRREGEKVLVADVKEMFAQLLLSCRLAVSSFTLSQAQSAALCGSPEEFHVACAANISAAFEGALDAAKREGVLPHWIL